MSEVEEKRRGGKVEWYCVRSKSKSEHIAAAHLRQLEEVEVFCPRIQYLKATRRGKVWFKEALFPGYLFVRFDLEQALRAVSAAHDVTKVVRFGEEYPVIRDDVMEELKRRADVEELVTIEEKLEPGDGVELVEGPMRGMSAVVRKVLPARERVKILLEFLGQDREVEVDRKDVLSEKGPRDHLAAP